jgi:hypothetical protein
LYTIIISNKLISNQTEHTIDTNSLTVFTKNKTNTPIIFVVNVVGTCLVSYPGNTSLDSTFSCAYTQIFEKYKSYKSTNNKSLYDVLKRVSFSERIVCLDIIITYELFKIKGLSFCFADCLREIKTLLADVIQFILDNESFVIDLYADIQNIIFDRKTYKTSFQLGFFHLDALIYLSMLIKSIHYVNHSPHHDELLLEGKMLHRNVVMSNLSSYATTFKLLKKGLLLKNNCAKLMMLLTTYIIKKKIVVHDKNNWKAKLIGKAVKSNNAEKLNLSTKKSFKTNIYLKFNVKTNNSYNERILFKIGFKGFKHFEDYLVCCSYLTLCEHTIKSNFQHSKNKIDHSAIITLSKKPTYINYQWWPQIVQKLIDNFNKDYYCSKSYFSDIATISGIKEQLEFMLADETKLCNDSDDNIDNKMINSNHPIIKSEKYIRISKDIQRLHYMVITEKLKHIDQPFYTANYYDFRGRIYPDTAASFMYLKPMRACFKCEDGLVDHGSLQNSIYFNKIIEEKVKFHSSIERLINSPVDKYFFSILFLELGKLNKSKIISATGITLQTFVDYGFSLFTQNDSSTIDKDDYAYYLSINNVINKFLKTYVWDNTLIIRDSTASAFQHWGRSLRINELYLDKLNLRGSRWYDTYTFIIELFLKKHPHFFNFKELKGLLTRKLLKQVIMVSNYNAGKVKCLEGFSDLLKESGLFKEEHSGIYREFIYEFHDFLKTELFSILYLDDITNFLEKHSNTFELEDSRLHMNYYDSIEHQEVIKIGKDRWVFNIKKIQTDININKTKIALNANIVQAQDAELARHVINKCNVWAVHDSFAIGMFNIHHVMDTINLFFNQKLGLDNYCLFIII